MTESFDSPFGVALKIALIGDERPDGVRQTLSPAQRTLFTTMIARRWIAGRDESETPREILPGEVWWKPPGGKTSRRHSTWPDVVETKTKTSSHESETYVSVVDVALEARAALGERWLRAVDFRRARYHEEPGDPRWLLYLKEAEWVQSKPGTDPIAMQVRDSNLSEVRAQLEQLLRSGARPKGRPATGASLEDRKSDLQEAAIRVASKYPKPPSKKVVAAALAQELEWSQFGESTLANRLRTSWWDKTKSLP